MNGQGINGGVRTPRVLSLLQYAEGFSYYTPRPDDPVNREIVWVRAAESKQAAALREQIGENAYFDRVRLDVSTDRYIVIPESLYEEPRNVQYLGAKNFTRRDNEVILTSVSEGMVFVMLVNADLFHFLSARCRSLTVSHVLERCTALGRLRCDPFRIGPMQGHIAVALLGNLLHVSFRDAEQLQFIDTFPVSGEGNILYFLRRIVSQFRLRDYFTLSVVTEDGRMRMERVCEKLACAGWERILPERYYTL